MEIFHSGLEKDLFLYYTPDQMRQVPPAGFRVAGAFVGVRYHMEQAMELHPGTAVPDAIKALGMARPDTPVERCLVSLAQVVRKAAGSGRMAYGQIVDEVVSLAEMKNDEARGLIAAANGALSRQEERRQQAVANGLKAGAGAATVLAGIWAWTMLKPTPDQPVGRQALPSPLTPTPTIAMAPSPFTSPTATSLEPTPPPIATRTPSSEQTRLAILSPDLAEDLREHLALHRLEDPKTREAAALLAKSHDVFTPGAHDTGLGTRTTVISVNPRDSNAPEYNLVERTLGGGSIKIMLFDPFMPGTVTNVVAVNMRNQTCGVLTGQQMLDMLLLAQNPENARFPFAADGDNCTFAGMGPLGTYLVIHFDNDGKRFSVARFR